MNKLKVLPRLVTEFRDFNTSLEQVKHVVAYLRHYGYLDSLKNITIEDVLNAIKVFQKFANLYEDGLAGQKTLGIMYMPRCGVKDIMKLEVEAAKWRPQSLTYYIAGRDSDLSAEMWDSILAKALNQWAEVADLSFTRVQVRSQANLVFDVGSGRKDGFDGPGGTLAWAQIPSGNSYQGQLLSKADKDETWRAELNGPGILFLNVMCHEIGHLLGLDHSNIQSALMAPFYNANIFKPVANDDIRRIQALYGAPSGGPVTPPPNPTTILAPSNLVVSMRDASSVFLKWKDNSTGEDNFHIYRNDVKMGSVRRGVVAAIDTNVPNGTHQYYVVAQVGDKVSDKSNIASITVGQDIPTPPQPSKLLIELTGNVTEISIPGYRVTKIG